MTATLSADLRQQLDALPPFSARVLRSLLEQLYAEPGFTDVEANDIAKAIKAPRTSMGGAIAHLVSVGLVKVDKNDINGRLREFLYSPLHDEQGTKELAIAYLSGEDVDDTTSEPTPTPSTTDRRDSKRARRIVRNALRAASWVAFAETFGDADELYAAQAALDAADALLATLPGYGLES